MHQGLQLSPQLNQSLVLSPQLQQSLALLQAPLMELKALVEKELEQNPVLEEVPAAEVDSQQRAEETGENPNAALDPTEPPRDVLYDPATEKPADPPADEFQTEFEKLAQADQDWREHFAQSTGPIRSSPEDEGRRQHLFDSLTREESLQEILMDQIRLSEIPDDRRALAELIVGNIEDDGHLKTPVEELAATSGATPEAVAETLAVIQTFDPPGIGARDLRECLLLQLRRLRRESSLEFRIVEHCMELLTRRRIPDIATALDTTVEEVQEAISRIAQLNPKPGLLHASQPDQYVIPEVFVRREGDDFVVTVNNADIPHLRVSNVYKDLMSRGSVDVEAFSAAFTEATGPVREGADDAAHMLRTQDNPAAEAALRALMALDPLTPAQGRAIQHARTEVAAREEARHAREYVREKIGAAKFLIKSIDLRQKTLLNIAREIVHRQRDFLDRGREFLKPMNMAEIGAVVGVHETTVSRAVAGKYMECPQGTIELRALFTTGLQTAEGPAIANTSVKEMVAEIFHGEDAKAPLSDEAVAKLLQERGIRIARRTVMKYRDLLGIPSSSLRKVY